jgi:citrate lyase subunit beta/citryl-CoA lyase
MSRTRIRRSLLFVPGNNPSMIQNCSIYGADTIILDLEDSVALAQKDAARKLVTHAIQELDFGHAEIAVRINPFHTEEGKKDIEAMMEVTPDVLIVPKSENAEEVLDLDKRLDELPIGLIPLLETPAGILHGDEIAASCDRVYAISFGAEDYATAMGINRTREGRELFVPRSLVAMYAKAAGVSAVDTVFADVNDEEGLLADTREALSLGFEGKLAISPRQISIINEQFTPTEQEIERARRIVETYRTGLERGLGAIALDGQMIDAPVVQRAERILSLAKMAGIIGGDEE